MEDKLQPSAPLPRRRKAVAMGGLLRDVLAPAAAKQGVLLAQIMPFWPSICPLLANYAVPESLRAGTLTLAAHTSSAQRELQFITPSIIEGANIVLGYTVVQQVKVVVRGEAAKANPLKLTKPLPPLPQVADKAAKVCQTVADDALRAALTALGAQVLKT